MQRRNRVRSKRAARNHPIYAARLSKEHPLLEDLIAGDSNTAAYIAALEAELLPASPASFQAKGDGHVE